MALVTGIVAFALAVLMAFGLRVMVDKPNAPVWLVGEQWIAILHVPLIIVLCCVGVASVSQVLLAA